jgi:DNA repair exonuclease SbcCD ATPase subunit
MSEQPAQKTMDPTQLHKMTEVLGADLRSMKEQLEKERQEKQRIIEEQKAREAEFTKMQEHLNRVKEEKKQYYSGMIDSKVKPFLEDLRKQSHNDSRMSDSLSRFENQLNQGLDNAFMDPDQLATLQVAVAASAANQVTSSKLEELFQSQKQWEEKFGALQKEKEELEKAQSDAKKQLEEANSLKEKMVEDLKRELEELKAKHEKSINNAESHFEEGVEPKMTDAVPPAAATTPAATAAPVPSMPAPAIPAVSQQTTTIPATASDKNFYGGFNTLFDFTPRDSWRSNRRD